MLLLDFKGTFGRINHALVVGVCGGVADPTDARNHIRPGDVVVSYSNNNDGTESLYTLCDKIEYVAGRSG